MKTIQEIFDRLAEKRKEVSFIRKKYQEELAVSVEYGNIRDQMEKLRAKKKTYEASIKQMAGANFARMDELSMAVRADAQMLSDVALTTIMKGEPVAVRGEGRDFEPVFTVRFKKK